MKKIIISRILRLTMMSILFTACGEEFLTEVPRDRLVDESFFQNTKHIEQSIHPLYTMAAKISADAQIIGVQLGADDLLSVDDLNKADFEEFDLFNRTSVNRRSQGIWAWSYFTIIQANFILDNIDRADSHQEVKNLAIAQARFFRAYAYFWLTRLWGPVPKVVSSDISVDVKMGEVNEIYDLILDDLATAEGYIPESIWNVPELSDEVVNEMPEMWRNNEALVNRGWIKALRSYVYLTMAGWPLKRTELYAKAAEESKYIIDNADKWGYKLLEDFHDLWLKENNFHKEGIIWFGYHPDGTYLHLAPNSGRPIDEPDAIMRGWNDYMVEIPFYEAFPDDYRKKVTFTTGWYTGKVGDIKKWVEWQDHGYRHPYIAKWRSTDGFPSDSTWSKDYLQDNHHRALNTMRYAHILLIYAESQTRANNGIPNELAIQCLNQVRRRANKLPIFSPSEFDYTTGEGDFAEKVLEEKGWEFIAEPNSRWYDLVRLEKVEKILVEIISYRTEMRENPTHPYFPLNKAILIPGQRNAIPTDIKRLNWLMYPEKDVLVAPDVFEGYSD